MSDIHRINNSPNSDILWRGLAGHFDSFTQIVNEFIDNSISNIKSHPNLNVKQIKITLTDSQDCIQIKIEDSGTGFKHIDNAFTLGAQDAQDSTMNEHGFGFKHALATANPKNDAWKIATRTESQHSSGSYSLIKSPYKFEDFTYEELSTSELNWPGDLDTTGTVFMFSCSKPLFNTVTEGISGNHGFLSQVRYLAEDLGFTYSDLISDNIAPITLVAISSSGEQIYNQPVVAIEPQINNFIFPPGEGVDNVVLDGSPVKVEYKFCDIKKHSDCKKYYQRSMSTSGVEVRLNGRMIDYSLFSEVWNIEKHNSFNYLLVKLNLISDDKSKLPTTRTSKNGIRKGDKKLEDLFAWVRGFVSRPTPSNHRDDQDEKSLFEKLAELKEAQLPNPKNISLEKTVFGSINYSVRIDLWQFWSPIGLTIYEGKKLKTSPQDVYQLRMYWDGCIIDNHNPVEGILIGSEHPDSVYSLVATVNSMTDANGNNYNFTIKTWRDEGIDYPNRSVST
jgi:hypothetical protein